MINFKEESTKRGIVWVITAIIAIYGWSVGKDITPVLTIGMAVAGGLGVLREDSKDASG